MEKREASETVAAPSDLDEVIFYTGPPPDKAELQPYVSIKEENQTGRIKASGTISPPDHRGPIITSYLPSDLDQALRSCGAPPPTTMLKPYVRVAKSKGRLQARGTMCVTKDTVDNKTSIPSMRMDISPPKSVPKRRKANKKPPAIPRNVVQRPLMCNLVGGLPSASTHSASTKNLPRQRKSRPPLRSNRTEGLTSALTENLPRPPKSRPPLRNNQARGLTSASTENLPRPPKSRFYTSNALGGLTSAAAEENLSQSQNKSQMFQRSFSERWLPWRKKRNKPAVLSAPSHSGYSSKLKGPSPDQSFKKRPAEKLMNQGRSKSVEFFRESRAPIKVLLQHRSRYSETQETLSAMMSEVLDRANGMLRPSDVKHFEQSSISS